MSMVMGLQSLCLFSDQTPHWNVTVKHCICRLSYFTGNFICVIHLFSLIVMLYSRAVLSVCYVQIRDLILR